MIKIENVEVMGWEHAIRGMRNPMNSWDKSDSSHCNFSCDDCDNFSVCNVNNEEYFKRFWEEDPANTNFAVGPNDHTLMMNLAHGGPVHAKYRRMIAVYLDIAAPLYWWKEFDTYKVGTVANSCSTMHKIHAKEFELSDFSSEHMHVRTAKRLLDDIDELNFWRDIFLNGGEVDNYDGTVRVFKPHDKDAWWQMIQLLPTSYNQKRTVMFNYEVLHNIHDSRMHHKLDEWREFCKWIEKLPYSELIIGEKEEVK